VTWIQPITFVSRDKGCVYLNVPNKFFRDWLTEHYLTRIEEVLSKTAQQKLRVSLDVKQEPQIKTIAEKIVGKDEREREKGRRTSNLIPRYTFENFVVAPVISLLTQRLWPWRINPATIIIRSSSMAGSVSVKRI
jgi:chromosomal replication initiator protein